MSGAACAAKILLCSPPVAQRVANVMAQAAAVAVSALEYGSKISDENMTALQHAVCQSEKLAAEIEKICRDPLKACMNDVYVCD
jgi:hypothetical protein